MIWEVNRMSLLQKQNNASQSKQRLFYCLISGVLAAVIMVIFLNNHDNSLFGGDATVLRMDLYHQYGPLYAEFYDRIVNGQSLIYSWTSGLGNSFLGNLFNYCASPFVFVLLLLGHKNMPEAMAVMMSMKAILAAMSYTYFINKSTKKNHIFSIGFGLLYAFCGYFVAYSWNIMWMDAMAVFPLVMLGIENIIERKSPTLFIITLTYTMITNYYMAYMVCILSVIYFLFYYFSNYSFSSKFERRAEAMPEDRKYGEGLIVNEETAEAMLSSPAVVADNAVVESIIPENTEAESFTEQIEEKPATVQQVVQKPKEKRRSVKGNRFLTTGVIFGLSALLCAMISAFALLPLVFCLNSSSATSGTFPQDASEYFTIFDFISNHLADLEPTIRSSGDIVLPNVYSGILSILLLPAFFFSDKIRGRQKIAAVVILGVFFFSFNLNILNYIWHGMHYPNDLPYRFSFAYSFILLTFAYKALMNIGEFSRKYFVGTGFAVLFFIILAEYLGSENVYDSSVILSIVFVIVYIIMAGLITSKVFTRKNLEIMLVFMIVIEVVFSDSGNLVMSQSKSNYTGDYDSYQEISALTEQDEDMLFYRTELSKLRARMDPSWYGYNGVSVFSSMAYEKTSGMMSSLGLFGNEINSYTYYPQTPVFNSFFSLRYIYDNSDLLSENDYYTHIAENDNYTAYKYNYFLPIAFSVNSDIRDWDPNASGNPFDVQNDLVRLSAGVDEVFSPVEASDIVVSNFDTVSLATVNSGTKFTVNKVNTSSDGTAHVFVDVAENGQYYVYVGSTRISGMKITAGDDFTYQLYSSSTQPFILDMGYLKAGQQITVEYTVDTSNDSATLTFCAAKLNSENFEKAYDQIQKNGVIAYTDFEETEFSGSISVTNKNSFIFTSVPFDKSWHIFVDGEELRYYNENTDEDAAGKVIAVGKGLLGFEIGRGIHTLTFKYQARGLSRGLMISAVGLGIALILLLIKFLRFKKQRAAQKEQETVISLPPIEEEEKQAPVEERREADIVIPQPVEAQPHSQADPGVPEPEPSAEQLGDNLPPEAD